MTRVVLATRNAGKVTELRRILAEAAPGVELVGLESYPDMPEVEETGETFAENALLKARAVAAHTGLAAVADDSGLCVDFLGGAPGVRSARWAGEPSDDERNLRLVLDQLADAGEGMRGAHFFCAAAAVVPRGGERVAEGRVDGTLIASPRGTNGFGYDPIFVPLGETRTTAELSSEEKDAISHRGKAFRALAPSLAALLRVAGASGD
ncbi:MAG TPA: RdgB/HAM1 family non-canonical purine NTP pyrophosphatase [Frankiaceae bacterium]|jgi:XTP/dITP diphosphohydrolase|nr:RdgB/HAM1 family non-canonical purine NTP pyrophosphatase [Frankiaceae bacterium]